MIIYKVINNINNKCYVGQTTKTLEDRKRRHKISMKRNEYNSMFYNAIRKYGWNNFKWEIICECQTREELNNFEIKYIKEYNTLYPMGYNICKGGFGSSLYGDKNGMYGKKHTDEAKQKMSENSNNKGILNPMYGKKHTEEAKNDMSLKHIGKSSWNKGLDIKDERVLKYVIKRKETMINNDIFKSGRNHPRFKNIDEDLLMSLYDEGLSYSKISKIFNTNKNFIIRRIKFIQGESI